MATVFVDVMPKPEILDPQGKAVTGALRRLGFTGLQVRQGKRFEIEVDGDVTRRAAGRDPARGRDAAGQHRDRDLRRADRPVTVRIGVVTFPGSLDDVDAARAVRLGGAEPVRALARQRLAAGRGRRDPARRLLLRRLPALRRDRPVLARDGRGDRGGRARPAGARASATASRCCARPTCCRAP